MEDGKAHTSKIDISMLQNITSSFCFNVVLFILFCLSLVLSWLWRKKKREILVAQASKQ